MCPRVGASPHHFQSHAAKTPITPTAAQPSTIPLQLSFQAPPVGVAVTEAAVFEVVVAVGKVDVNEYGVNVVTVVLVEISVGYVDDEAVAKSLAALSLSVAEGKWSVTTSVIVVVEEATPSLESVLS